MTTEARNYCIRQGIINGTEMDNSDIPTVWRELHEDYIHNVDPSPT
ncbi:hypothetical protein [Actinomadura sp. WMMB 499]|nr:hypothetical protein [Actinomadura sp. WMMB 499]